MRVLISAGEASSDRYAAALAEELRERFPGAEFFGCAGPRLREAGVEPVLRAEDLAVIGVFEVIAHIPRIYLELRRLIAAARRKLPDLAIVTDSPGFNLPVAKRLHRLGVPVFYYVAPQVWAWRRRRIRLIRRDVDHVLCIFPFEEEFFQERGVAATYVGHPLAGEVRVSVSREEFFQRHGLTTEQPLVALLPGSRRAEAARHLPAILDAVQRLRQWRPLQFVLPASTTTGSRFFQERIPDSAVQIVEEASADALSHADVALVASGTATVEAALLGAAMVTFYKVTTPSWLAGKFLVDVPFYTMVNLLAGRRVVPELMQDECTGENLAAEVRRLLEDGTARAAMQQDLAEIRHALDTPVPAARRAAEVICERFRDARETGEVRRASVSSEPL
jgi:lipid-A-disaccharide synthase